MRRWFKTAKTAEKSDKKASGADERMIIYLYDVTNLKKSGVPTERLSARGKEKFERLLKTAPTKAVQSAAGDLLVSYAAKKAGISAEIAETEFGKPYFLKNDLVFSVSHSKDIVVVGISEREHGVDVELLREIDDKTVRAVVNPLEYLKYLQADENEKIKTFFREFTEKESYVKMLGTGIRERLSKIKPTGVSFLTKYLFKESDVYCLTVCVKVQGENEEKEKFSFEVVKDLNC